MKYLNKDNKQHLLDLEYHHHRIMNQIIEYNNMMINKI